MSLDALVSSPVQLPPVSHHTHLSSEGDLPKRVGACAGIVVGVGLVVAACAVTMATLACVCVIVGGSGLCAVSAFALRKLMIESSHHQIVHPPSPTQSSPVPVSTPPLSSSPPSSSPISSGNNSTSISPTPSTPNVNRTVTIPLTPRTPSAIPTTRISPSGTSVEAAVASRRRPFSPSRKGKSLDDSVLDDSVFAQLKKAENTPRYREIDKFLTFKKALIHLKSVDEMASFEIVDAYLKMMYCYPLYRDDKFNMEECGRIEELMKKHIESGTVQRYLDYCLDSLPQTITDAIAENVGSTLLYNGVETKQQTHIAIICNYASSPTVTQLFASSAFGDTTMLQKCLQTGMNIEKTFNSKELSPYHFASPQTIAHLRKVARGQYKNIAHKREGEDKALFWTALHHADKNRDEDILPYEDTRVKLKDPNFYYNADRVLDGLGIAAQGPQEGWIPDFWKMIDEKNSNIIVMMTNLKENGEVKCSNYLPEVCKQHGSVKVEVISENEVFKNGLERIVERRLLVNGKEKVHLHLENWPDHGAVTKESLLALVKIVLEHYQELKGTILGHCMMGVGRTGTFFAALQIYIKRVYEGCMDPFLVEKVVAELRRERAYSVVRERQYQLLWDFDDLLF